MNQNHLLPSGGREKFRAVDITVVGDCSIVKMKGHSAPHRRPAHQRSSRCSRHGWTHKAKKRYAEAVLVTKFECHALLTIGADPLKVDPDKLYHTLLNLLNRRGMLQKFLSRGRLQLAAYNRFHYLGPMELHLGKKGSLPLLHWHVMLNVSLSDTKVIDEVRQFVRSQLGSGATLLWKEIKTESERERVRRYTCKSKTKVNSKYGIPPKVYVMSHGIPRVTPTLQRQISYSDHVRNCKAHGVPIYRKIHYGKSLLQPDQEIALPDSVVSNSGTALDACA